MGGSGTGTGGSGGRGTGGGVGASGGSGGAAPAPGEVVWENSYGDIERDTAAGIAYLTDGGIVIAGYFEGSLDFGGGALVSGGGSDAFAARIGTDGIENWAQKWGGAGAETVRSVAADDSNGVFLFGSFADTIDFGSPPQLTSVDEGDLFAAKLTAQGDGLWAKRMGSIYIDTAYHVRSGPGGDPAFAGTFQDGISIDTTNLTGPQQTPCTFISKLAGVDGQVGWAEVAEPAGYPAAVSPHAIAIDTAGNVAFFAQGAVQGSPGISVTYDGTTENSPSNYRLLMLYRTDSNGGLAWRKRFELALAGDVSTFPNGDILACGVYQGAGTFATGFSLPTAQGNDVWVAKYSAAGTLAWARLYGGAGNDGGGSSPVEVRCKALSDGSYLLVAPTDGPFDINGSVVPGTTDSVVVAHVAAAGDPIWTVRTSGPGKVIDAIVSNDGDEVALLLNYDGTTGLVGTFDAVGSDDIYVARIAL